jgi:DNA-directed RNA polymerase specialized sigma24 family protein
MRAPRTTPDRETARRSPAGRDADHAVTSLYATHYRALVKMAALLVQDLTTAEEIVQDSFVAVHAAWRRRPDTGHALSCLRRSVVDRSRAVPRQRAAVERSAFISALWTLPARQREVVVLRYFANLPETEVASATGISEATVKAHAARAVSSLRAVLQRAAD